MIARNRKTLCFDIFTISKGNKTIKKSYITVISENRYFNVFDIFFSLKSNRTSRRLHTLGLNIFISLFKNIYKTQHTRFIRTGTKPTCLFGSSPKLKDPSSC